MTLQASGFISLGDVLVELQRANAARVLPISLGDQDVLALAGHPGPACQLSDLYGKSSGGSGGGSPTIPISVSASDALGQRSNSGFGPVTCSSTATVLGASGAVSFSWLFVGGRPFQLSGASSETCSFTASVGDRAQVFAQYQVTVVDAAGRSASCVIQVEVQGTQTGVVE
jgi:hypothetical protein